MSSALELTPEKFHDFLSLASSPAILKSGSPGAAAADKSCTEGDVGGEALQVVGTPAPLFSQVHTLAGIDTGLLGEGKLHLLILSVSILGWGFLLNSVTLVYYVL